MKTAVLITGLPDDVDRALRAINVAGGNLPSLELCLDQVLIGRAVEDLRSRGHRVVEDARMARIDRMVLLELVPGDVRRLRLLEPGDYTHVMAAARRMVHQHLDAIQVAPSCRHCAT